MTSHYEDGPRLIGGAELPRVADTHETGAWCAARGPSVEVERDGEVAVLRNVVICDRPYNHRGNHENRKYDVCWAQKARTYTEGFWRRLEAARKAPPKKVDGWSFDVSVPVPHGTSGVRRPASGSKAEETQSSADGRATAVLASGPLDMPCGWKQGAERRSTSVPKREPERRLPLAAGADTYNPDDASWETQDRVWADEEIAERDATSERRAGRVLRGG